MALEEGSKTVRWIDLFFDLVFVAAAHELTSVLKKTASFTEGIPYIILFIMLLWLWISHTLYSARFESRGWLYNLNTFLSMISIFGLVILMGGAFDEYLAPFAILYAFSKALLVIFYLEGLLKNPLRLLHILPLLLSYIVSMIFWAASPFVEYPLVLWTLAFIIDVTSPLYGKPLLSKIQVHAQHLPERLGLLAVVMLGEMVISLVISAHGLELTPEVIATLVLGMMTTAMLFLSYFRFVEQSIVDSENSQSLLYLYSHVPFYLSLILFAASFKGALVNESIRWQFTLAILLFIISFRSLKYITEEYLPKRQLFLFIIYASFTILYFIFYPDTLVGLSILTMLFLIYLFISEYILTLFASSKSDKNQFRW